MSDQLQSGTVAVLWACLSLDHFTYRVLYWLASWLSELLVHGDALNPHLTRAGIKANKSSDLLRELFLLASLVVIIPYWPPMLHNETSDSVMPIA